MIIKTLSPLREHNPDVAVVDPEPVVVSAHDYDAPGIVFPGARAVRLRPEAPHHLVGIVVDCRHAHCAPALSSERPEFREPRPEGLHEFPELFSGGPAHPGIAIVEKRAGIASELAVEPLARGPGEARAVEDLALQLAGGRGLLFMKARLVAALLVLSP